MRASVNLSGNSAGIVSKSCVESRESHHGSPVGLLDAPSLVAHRRVSEPSMGGSGQYGVTGPYGLWQPVSSKSIPQRSTRN